MNSSTRSNFGAALAIASALLGLQGCMAYVSRGIDADGTATEVIFPTIDTDASLPEGTFPSAENLRAVGAGMSKDQLYALLGRPHFREGLVAVREWDYVFNFRAHGAVRRCQYKVLFDADFKARQFHWSPAACAGG